MTTYTAWLAALATLAPTGVVKKYTTGPPVALNTADLPAQWLALPRGEHQAACAGTEGGDRRLFVDLWVALEPVAQDSAGANFTATITMLDAVDAALTAFRASSPLDGPMTWRSDGKAFVTIGGINYWCIRTSIDGLG
jgi:hypothetical protein